MNLNARSVAKALGGDVRGGRVYAPGPGHSPHDRSMWVAFDWQAPDGFYVGSFAGDDGIDCKDYVRAKLGFPAWEPRRSEKSETKKTVTPRGAVNAFTTDDDDRERTQSALRVFDAAKPIGGTIGEKYLAHRIGARLPWTRDIRFHSNCGGKFGEAQKLEFHLAIVALLRDIQTNQPRAVHRTFLKPDGSDRLRDAWQPGRDEGKKALGSSIGCAIKLSPDDEVTRGLGIVEGIETGLSLLALGWAPIWATCGTSTMAKCPLLAGIDALTIFADNDRKSAGRKAADECALRWAEAGREVQIVTPREIGTDWNDALRGAT